MSSPNRTEPKSLSGDEDASCDEMPELRTRDQEVVTEALIEAGMTKCVRVCWGRQRGVQRTKGRQQITYHL